MKQHSFQKGDLVVCKGYQWRGIFQEIDEYGSAHFRDGSVPCVCQISELTHDRDFGVGDWVRYECVKPMPLSHLLRDGIQGKIVECLNETVSVRFSEHGELFGLKDNLVKIAPPAEENVDKADTVIIEHDQWGRVEGVDKSGFNWRKNGALYTHLDGWMEVKPKRWVPVEVAIKEGGLVALANVNNNKFMPRHFNLDPGYRWKTVEIEREVEG